MKAKQALIIDTSFARAATLLLPRRDVVQIYLVGCGGTGSWLAPSIARIAKVAQDGGQNVRLTFIDGDHVEDKNIPRQNFCSAEVNLNKAVTLANRFGAAWGLEVSAIPQMFARSMFHAGYNELSIIIGCVDNAAARRLIASCLDANKTSNAHNAWWLDCGNYNDGGQVLLGSAPTPKEMKGAFVSAKTVTALPSPALQSPDLLVPRKEETGAKMSCAEMMAANLQGMAVNQHVAAIGAAYLSKMILGEPLKIFATSFNQHAMSAVSKPITIETIAATCGKVELMKVK
jgi:PRTRC genetic system ThiF family protein